MRHLRSELEAMGHLRRELSSSDDPAHLQEFGDALEQRLAEAIGGTFERRLVEVTAQLRKELVAAAPRKSGEDLEGRLAELRVELFESQERTGAEVMDAVQQLRREVGVEALEGRLASA